ncbi:hypothetical protein BWI93_10300 [Siphonobacter sp. BAB-5385]|uniref:S49 family peptidase n=1 Tax=Siphonobacter sp. BAB-5385 TaxID=1864822 RepID=UPI000B9DD8ED|nr:S49 family peptidase [Siphonobacter sp. BAB-5385]OZI08249.1 hypothetical protein BWI93_10300 [Siphonobacter sp. BAB-5385]
MTGLSFSGLWYINADFASQMGGIIFPRLQAGKDPFPPHLIQASNSNTAPRPSLVNTKDEYGDFSEDRWYLKQFQKAGGGDVAVFPIEGSMSRNGYCNMGNEQLARIVALAKNEPSIRAAVVRPNTPGGTVDSTRMLTEAFIDFQKSKPLIAQTPFCCSAGYFSISNVQEIWLEDQTETRVGSIGVLAVYMDETKALEKQGLSVQIIRADGSEQKSLINGIEPLTDELKAQMKEEMNEARQEFIGFVRRGRAGKITSDEPFTGAVFKNKRAIELGLADRIGSLSQAITRARQLA